MTSVFGQPFKLVLVPTVKKPVTHVLGKLGAANRTDVTIGGSAAIGNDITKQVGKSLGIAEGIAVPIILVLLVFAFGDGLAHSGRIVTTAAALIAVTFFAFGTATVSFLQLFGIGAGFAVIIDATLVRAVLVPACQRILGRAAWYAPAPLRRLQARIGLAEARGWPIPAPTGTSHEAH